MDLDVAYPFFSVYLHPCMAVIGTRIAVMLPDRQDLYAPSIRCLLLKSRPQAMLPYIMQNYFRHTSRMRKVSVQGGKNHGDNDSQCE